MKQMRMMDEHMARVPKAQFNESQTLLYDVFVRLGTDHFVLVGRNGSPSTIHRLKAFEADLVPWFYVSRTDYPRYVEQTVSKASVLSMAGVPRAQLLSAVSVSLASVMELVRVGGFGPSSWLATQKLSELVREMATARPALSVLMSEVAKLGEASVRHAVAVAMLAALVAQEMGLGDHEKLHLAQAGLLHDIGWVRLPADLISKREDLLRGEELRSYQSHPLLGANLLRDCSQVPSEVVKLVYEHHENALGTGYPRQLGLEKLDSSSLVLAMAERYCELTLGDGMHQDFLTPAGAVNTIANVEGHPFPMDLLKVLERLVRAVPSSRPSPS